MMLRCWNKGILLTISTILALDVDIPKITTSFQSKKADDLKKLSVLLESYTNALSAELETVEQLRDALKQKNLDDTNRVSQGTEFVVAFNMTIQQAETNPLATDLNKLSVQKEIDDLQMKKANIEESIAKTDAEKLSVIDLKFKKDSEISVGDAKLMKLLLENGGIDELVKNELKYLDLLDGEIPFDFEQEDFDVDKEIVELEGLKKDVLTERQKELDRLNDCTKETESLRKVVDGIRSERDSCMAFLRFFQNDEKVFERKMADKLDETKRGLSLVEKEIQERFGESLFSSSLKTTELRRKIEEEKNKNEAVLKNKEDEMVEIETKMGHFDEFIESLKQEPSELLENDLLRMNEVNKRSMINIENIRELEKKIIEITSEMSRSEIACTIGVTLGTLGYILYLIFTAV